ncbi:MAG: phage tail family protein, partial [Clostridia bacterium]|nr:phage tail family protein [Clostridia bacterium]
DCKTGQIFLNGIATPALGALGNDWEDFTLTPGINQIGFSYSEWVEADYAPTFKVKYREVFL